MEEPKIMFASASTAELTVEAISCTSCNVASPSEATLITVASQMFWREIVQGKKRYAHLWPREFAHPPKADYAVLVQLRSLLFLFL